MYSACAPVNGTTKFDDSASVLYYGLLNNFSRLLRPDAQKKYSFKLFCFTDNALLTPGALMERDSEENVVFVAADTISVLQPTDQSGIPFSSSRCRNIYYNAKTVYYRQWPLMDLGNQIKSTMEIHWKGFTIFGAVKNSCVRWGKRINKSSRSWFRPMDDSVRSKTSVEEGTFRMWWNSKRTRIRSGVWRWTETLHLLMKNLKDEELLYDEQRGRLLEMEATPGEGRLWQWLKWQEDSDYSVNLVDKTTEELERIDHNFWKMFCCG